MAKIKHVVAQTLEHFVSIPFVRRYGLAILVALMPFVFWATESLFILFGVWDRSFVDATLEWISQELFVLTVVLLVYGAIFSLEWRDRRRQQREDDLPPENSIRKDRQED